MKKNEGMARFLAVFVYHGWCDSDYGELHEYVTRALSVGLPPAMPLEGRACWQYLRPLWGGEDPPHEVLLIQNDAVVLQFSVKDAES